MKLNQENTMTGKTETAGLNSVLFKSILVFVSILAVWKVITLGAGQQYEQHILEKDQAISSSLAWSPDQPSVLFKEALELGDSNPDQTIKLLERSINGNPSDGRVQISLGNYYLKQNKIPKADKLIEQATKNLPSDAYTHIEAASYWLRRNNLDKALFSWNIALQTTPAIKTQLFPQLLQWLENGQLNDYLDELLSKPPVWWEEFFLYAAKNASRIETLENIYYSRKKSPTPITKTESESYVSRLKQEDLWAEAFLAWLNSLGPQGLKYMSQPYNGSFEAPFSQSAFGWNYLKIPGVLVETEHTYGNKTGKALHVVFQGTNINFRHIYQTLFLGPAKYQFSGRVRPDSLITTGGLQWRISCDSNKKQSLGESVRFLGAGQWRTFKFEFEVMEKDCKGQDLRLMSVNKNKEDKIISGEIWFDSIAIQRLQ